LPGCLPGFIFTNKMNTKEPKLKKFVEKWNKRNREIQKKKDKEKRKK